MAFVLHVPQAPEDQGSRGEESEESELHLSFHQLIQEQSRGPGEDGLELQARAPASHHQALQAPEAAAHSTATLRILASMPSRTIGCSRGAIISQFYNRSVRLRRRGSRPALRGLGRSARPSLRLYDLELDATALAEEEKRVLLVKELQGLPLAQRGHMLRGMPLSLAEKRCLREETRAPRRSRGRPGPLACCSRLRYACALALHDLGLALLAGLQALAPWHYALKRIGGQFGSSVLSYFLFLKTLLAFNVLLLLPLLAFLVGVQTAFPPAPRGPHPAFTGLELLTGGQWHPQPAVRRPAGWRPVRPRGSQPALQHAPGLPLHHGRCLLHHLPHPGLQHVPLFRGELPGGQHLGGPRHHRFLLLGPQGDSEMGLPPPA
ncbi:unnamed protein product [Pipistrellus nathusii]|uniref:TMC6 n=1 Tax=Pipistrellus nathusii TaxID=59473 RepID=A0ABN9ZKL5_PIPNA